MKLTNKNKPYFDDFEFAGELWVPEYEEQSSEHSLRSRIKPYMAKSKINANEYGNNSRNNEIN